MENEKAMTKGPGMKIGLGIAAGLAVGAVALYLARQDNKKDLIHKIGDAADQARNTASDLAKTVKGKVTPVMQTVADLVEKNAELVSAVANISSDQVRKTGQEIRQAADMLDKNLDALTNL